LKTIIEFVVLGANRNGSRSILHEAVIPACGSNVAKSP
jgi:hypothetical protein